ncbi:undecaprenyl-phosphate glucose phosphotransferase [Thermoflexus sp.]|jgi:exopolysaccharide biosynthesis polyprenyl glycosylphosphotransferase|uniref:undecaprenyl-phosphate glucose phosphotransferase n=1 Tax=Thermoflexus sp. TaxID=1969742 RepID=UPI00260E081E|nr:undecaprenyl-phosphate glucose phosphotransferase [Thermoflexus sp.]
MGDRKVPRGWKWLRIGLDLMVIQAAFVLAYFMRYRWEWFREITFDAPFSAYIPFQIAWTVLLLVTFRLDRVYPPQMGAPWLEEMYRVLNAVAKSTLVLMAVVFFSQSLFYSRLMFLEAALLVVWMLGALRLLESRVERMLRRRGLGVVRALIVGAGDLGRAVMRAALARPELGYRIIGFVDDDPEKARTDIGPFRARGTLEDLPRVLREEAVDEVIITLPLAFYDRIQEVVQHCEAHRVPVRIVPDPFQLTLSRLDVRDLDGIPLIGIREARFSPWQFRIKRAMDLILATVLLILAAPLMALIALAIRLDSPGPVIFRQVRVGKDGRLFTMYKFRTMRVGAEQEQERLRALNEASGPLFKIRNDPRVTRVGRILRRLSLDELPQLVNVLKGEMSLVGPRPPVPSEVEAYKPWQRQRLSAIPGMTGLWQISGRSDLTFDEMCLLDIYYIENWSPLLDLEIMLRTIPRVIMGEGAY